MACAVMPCQADRPWRKFSGLRPSRAAVTRSQYRPQIAKLVHRQAMQADLCRLEGIGRDDDLLPDNLSTQPCEEKAKNRNSAKNHDKRCCQYHVGLYRSCSCLGGAIFVHRGPIDSDYKVLKNSTAGSLFSERRMGNSVRREIYQESPAF